MGLEEFWGGRRTQEKPRTRTAFTGAGQSAMDERGRPRGGDSQHEVFRPRSDAIDLDGAILGTVFGAFLRPDQSLVATRDDSLDHFRVGSKGRRHLRGIQNTQPSRGPRTHVDQTPPAPESLHDQFDRLRNFEALGPDGLRHSPILEIDEVDQLERRQHIHGRRTRISLRRQSVIEHVGDSSPDVGGAELPPGCGDTLA